MARQVERWEKADDKLHQEEELTAREARQGRTGQRILTILIVALVLAFIIWIPVEIWGKREADQVAPQQPGQDLQNQTPAPNPQPNLQNGGAVPTEPNPGTPAQQ